jgi:hypothetical protein
MSKRRIFKDRYKEGKNKAIRSIKSKGEDDNRKAATMIMNAQYA